MSCAFDKEKLSGYYDGELDPVEKSQVERHISSCSECLRDLEEIKSAALLVRSLPRLPAPPSVAEGVARAVASAGRAARFRVLRGTLLWTTAAAAGLLVALNVVFFSGFHRRSPPVPGAAGAPPDSAVPGLAWKGPPAEKEEKRSDEAGAATRPAAPANAAAEKAADAGQERRRAVLKEEERRGDGRAQGALEVPAAAPAAPPPPAAAPPADLAPTPPRGLRAEVAEARKSDVREQKGYGARRERPLADKGDAAEKEPVGEGPAAGAGEGKGLRPLVLTLAVSDPAKARARVVEVLKKIGVAPSEERLGRGAGDEGAKEGTGIQRAEGAAPGAPRPVGAGRPASLTADLSARQLDALREELRREKAIVVVVPKPSEKQQAADRAGAGSKSPATALRGLGASPAEPAGKGRPLSTGAAAEEGRRERAAEGVPVPEPGAPEGDAAAPEAGAPALYRLTVEFIILEDPPGKEK